MSEILNAAIHAALLRLARDLASVWSEEVRWQRVVECIGGALPCDAAVLLRWQDGQLVAVAAHGLAPELAGRRFQPQEHPRLAAILAATEPVRFPADTPLPDPFDGWLAVDAERELTVHACMGVSLLVDGEVVGVLTLDALAPGAFDALDDQAVKVLAALAAASFKQAALVQALQQASERQRLLAQELVQEAWKREGEIVGKSARLIALRDEIRLVAATDLAVLILGETGTGKELVARTLHAQSRRAEQALVHVNCAALPESIAESELFGHVKGAFTGANSDRPGKFELANGGTLFLDEIGELPLVLQAKLLRAIQQGEIQRVGADRNIRVDVRLIAATNRDLAQEVAAGRFRGDLYHRLNVYPVHVPPLREHKDDLAVLAGHFLEQARVRLGLQQIGLHPLALRALEAYDWPGNVREFEHLLMRASLRASREQRGRVLIRPEHLDLVVPVELVAAAVAPVEGGALPDGGLRQAVDAFERQLIERALHEAQGNWAAAARRLQVDRANLLRLARRLGVASESK